VVIDDKGGEVIHKDKGRHNDKEKMTKGEKYQSKGIN
jgi:hypothetical protein